MDAFVWNSWYETGIEPVDEQHQNLVRMINELAACDMDTAAGRSSVQTLLKALLDYVRQHFSDEERLMAEYGVDPRHVSRHQREHIEFMQEVIRLARVHSQSPHIDIEALYHYLVTWLVSHIMGTDQTMARQLALIRAGATPDAALMQEVNSPGQNYGLAAMQAALQRMYDVIAEQNQQLRASNELLENKVAERTQALEKTNAALLHEQQSLRALNEQLTNAQNQLLQSEKMAAIGQLAAGVAHEINNPIGYVNSNLGTLKTYVERLLHVLAAYGDIEKQIPAGDALITLNSIKQVAELEYLQQDVVDLLKESREGLERVKKIVQDLKDFSHVDEAEWADADLNHGLDSTLNVVWNEVKYKAKVIKDYGDIPPLNCVASQINQVFMNLIVNASHAIEDSGTITLRTRHEGNQVMIEVVDTGKGMPLEIQRRIFEPFFTTKPVGKGTGLGLSLSYDIVKKHGGRIEVSSQPGEGTSFKVWLPLTQEGKPA